MKNPADTQTLELISTPKKRGRPSTGRAMSAAERKRRQRTRDSLAVTGAIYFSKSRVVDFDECTTTGLIEHLRIGVAEGRPVAVRAICAELVRRAEENQL